MFSNTCFDILSPTWWRTWDCDFERVGNLGWFLKLHLKGTRAFKPTYSQIFTWKALSPKVKQETKFQSVLLMEEILYHLNCMKPCKYWDMFYHINWWSPDFWSINRSHPKFFVWKFTGAKCPWEVCWSLAPLFGTLRQFGGLKSPRFEDDDDVDDVEVVVIYHHHTILLNIPKTLGDVEIVEGCGCWFFVCRFKITPYDVLLFKGEGQNSKKLCKRFITTILFWWFLRMDCLFTLSPTIMVQWKMTILETINSSSRALFPQNHDY